MKKTITIIIAIVAVLAIIIFLNKKENVSDNFLNGNVIENVDVFSQSRQNMIYFGMSLEENEATLKEKGKLVDTYVESGEWWSDTYETYLYSMKWFNAEKPMNTYYIYRNGFLERIEIKPEENNYTVDDIKPLIIKMYGEATSSYKNDDGTLSESWEDTIYSKYISLESKSPCLITINSYSQGISNVLASYKVISGEADITDERYLEIWKYICNILPKEARQKISEFNVFSDGYSNILAYSATITKEDGNEDNTKFSINIDYYDVYDENDNMRDLSKLTQTIVHEYGHILLEDETQIDLTISENIHDATGFIEGSFRKKFFDAFWKDIADTGVGDYDENPTNYVSRYAANYFHEDIAETFATFVLNDKPEGTTVAEDKIRFFWNDESMVKIRSMIRENMELSI